MHVPDCPPETVHQLIVAAEPTAMSLWTILWISWLVTFLVIEIWASRKPGKTTLSEHVWQWFGIKGNKGRRWAKWLLRAGLVILTLHLGWGWP